MSSLLGIGVFVFIVINISPYLKQKRGDKMSQTDLDKVKGVAKMLLYTDLHVDETFEFLCHHPFFNTTATFDVEKGKLLDLTDEKQLEKARKMMEKQIDKLGNFGSFFMLIQKPYYPAFFKFASNYLNSQDFASGLAYIWTITEFPNHDANVSLNEFLNFFKKAEKDKLMSQEDLEAYNAFPEKVKVYRGTCLEATTKALSWTTDIDKARWFAERFGDNGKVYEAIIDKKDIFAYFAEGGEKETVLNYKKLEYIKEIEDLSKTKDERVEEL